MIHAPAILPKAVSLLASDSPVADAFGRVRISYPQSLFDAQCQYNAEALRFEGGNTGAGVAPAHNANTRLVQLQVNAGGAGTSFLQSFQYLPYQPAKSQLIAMTGVLGAAVAGAVKRFGYGDAANGIFYEQNGTAGVQFNRRTSTSGGVVDNTVTQANWNLDKFDGTGPSGITLVPTTDFILIIDLQYLGMGRVRIGFDIAGVTYYAHQFLCANVLTVPYMQMGTLPVLIELVAAGALAGVATCQFKCASVISEGGFQFDFGRGFTASNTVAGLTGTRVPVISLQPRLTFNGITNRGLFVLDSIELIGGGNAVQWEICIGVAFTVAPVFADVNTTYSFMQAGPGGTFNNLTTGVAIVSGYVAAGGGALRSVSGKDLAISYPITLDRSGAVRALGTLTVLCTNTAAASDTRVALNWTEIR